MRSWIKWVVKAVAALIFSLLYWFAVGEYFGGVEGHSLWNIGAKAGFYALALTAVFAGDVVVRRVFFGYRVVSAKEAEQQLASSPELHKRAWLSFESEKPFGGYERARGFVLSGPLFLSNKEFCLFALSKQGMKKLWKIVPTFAKPRHGGYSPGLWLEELLRVYAVDSPNKVFSSQDVKAVKQFAEELKEKEVSE